MAKRVTAAGGITALFVALALTSHPAKAAASAETGPLARLAWLAGDWEGDDAGVWNEERWMEPSGGMMLAVHRDTSGGKATSFEFLRIESTSDGIVYFASPRGKAPTPFRLVESGARRAVFENEQLEFPRRVIYWMEKEGELHARIEGTRSGKAQSAEWTWKRRRG
ncbi:MAG TPA: DUF6265 family protein [Thermoanaerobaculia bacterium]